MQNWLAVGWPLFVHVFLQALLTHSSLIQKIQNHNPSLLSYLSSCKALKRGIKVRMSRKEVLEKTGELISLRSVIVRSGNLES